MSSGEINPTQRFYFLQTAVILQKCVISLLERLELRSYREMLHLRGVKFQLWLKPLRRNLTHSVYSEPKLTKRGPKHEGKGHANGLSRSWNVAQMACRAIEMSRSWDVAQMEYRVVELSRNSNDAQMGCHARKKSCKWYFPGWGLWAPWDAKDWVSSYHGVAKPYFSF